MSFGDYFRARFPKDLQAVTSGLEPLHTHGPDKNVIQPRILSRENPVIRAMSPNRLQLFASALYLALAIDQEVHSKLRSSYPGVSARTRGPQFYGDCPGACQSTIALEAIFDAIGKRPQDIRYKNVVPASLAETLSTAKDDIVSFLHETFAELDSERIWSAVERRARAFSQPG
jgi:hypothetical protein